MQWPLPQFPTRLYSGGMVAVTAGGAAHTKGSWVTLASGLDQPGCWVTLKHDANSSSGSPRWLFGDIGIGGAGSETIVVSNVTLGSRGPGGVTLPLHVPAGATVRMRTSGLVLSALNFGLDVYGGEPDPGVTLPCRAVTYGANESVTSGVTITPSGTANVKGSYAEVVASTAFPIHGAMVLAQANASTFAAHRYAVDIAVGTAGAETIVLGDLTFTMETNGRVNMHDPGFRPLTLGIPAGVRLSARCASSTTSVLPLQVVVYGFTY